MPPLKGISSYLTADLMHALLSMGHGDEILIADTHFPSVSIAEATPKARLIDMSGHSAKVITEAVLSVFPLDTYVDAPATIMARVPNDEANNVPVPIWDVFQTLVNTSEGKEIKIERIERFEFYERAKKAFAVVITGERALYANILLTKGVITKF
jgi:L-fucose mutarotase